MRRSTFKNILNNQGMTLLEVMIALAIFSVFIVSYMVSQGYSIKDSTDLKEDIKLRALCLQVIDETTVTPPIFRESLTLTPETKKFEDDEDYSYTVIWKRLVIPDISKIQGSDPLEQDGKQSREGVIQKKIFDNVKKNLEEMIWQMEVTVESQLTKNKFILSTWLYNDKAKVKLDGL
ncbi:MAG: prepilin-type N-terminal cleavage/methylation domain-containing protein [Bacteriovoracaceae bacterium]|nr:prepilin-type N-terminal cleavage/methylation domain-containing protein [Bacteriovoracaceae bacterium]